MVVLEIEINIENTYQTLFVFINLYFNCYRFITMMNDLGGVVEVEHTTFLSVLGPGSKLNIETLRARLHSLPFKKGFVLLSIECIHRAQSCQTPLRGLGLEIQKMLYILKNYTTRCITCFHIG